MDGNQGELGAFWGGYQSRWIATDLMRDDPGGIAGAFFEASRLRPFIFQVNKGLSGEHPEARARDEETALHPGCFQAAALVIMAAAQQYAYPRNAGTRSKRTAGPWSGRYAQPGDEIDQDVTPGAGSYSTEADFFLEDWQQNQWGSNYPRLLAIKRTVDPENIFRVHHGVGSEL